MTQPAKRILVAIPAYNEAGTIAAVVGSVRASLPGYDLLVVNDGSGDATGQILETLNTTVATHLCNLGYGRAVQTAILYALDCGYDALVTLDADGQHHPEQIAGLLREFDAGGWDVLIGSRYVARRGYQDAPLGRRIGMQLFSMLVRLVIGQRVFDTSSGMKVIRRTVFDPLTHWHFVDFHAEAIVYLMRLGYRIGEFPVTVAERTQGTSMYTPLNYFKYPLKTSMLVLLGIIEAALTRRRHRS
ncbi:MAG TPA: glycosyltransferase family 2 protein [Pyrinomonadaceae bacterium]|nr:glycosyltransferase family 2 protein [Pyrinomonadaceae bacterium]